jgi:ribosome maturation factor RimP
MSGLVPTFFFLKDRFYVWFCKGLEMGNVERTYKEKIVELIEPVLESENLELVDVECLKMKTRWMVRIFMDKDGGITVDDCANISHQVGDILDVNDVPSGPYTLEVSSPGVTRPIFKDEDFIKYRGSVVSIKVDQAIDGIRNFKGELLDYVDEAGGKILIVKVAGATHRIPRDLVVKAQRECEF